MKLMILSVLILLVTVSGLYLCIKQPSNEGDWQKQYQVLPVVEVNGDVFSIKNIRDFRYNDNDTIRQVQYYDKSYDVKKLKDVWYGVSHFAKHGLAHVFLSFEFEGNDYLVLSIEARLTDKQEFQPIRGAFKYFAKTVVLGSEQDVIGLRTHIRKEKVYLYKLEMDTSTNVDLFKGFMATVDRINQEPDFYNTFWDNCLTGLLKEIQGFSGMYSWLDYRIFLPGYSDKLAYELGVIDNSRPFSEVKAEAKIDPEVISLKASDFSLKLRKNN